VGEGVLGDVVEGLVSKRPVLLGVESMEGEEACCVTSVVLRLEVVVWR
jgi:hypothetical protein